MQILAGSVTLLVQTVYIIVLAVSSDAKDLTPHSGVTADLAGAVGPFCNVPPTTASTVSAVSRKHRTFNSSTLTVSRPANDTPALPPRVPIRRQYVNSLPCRQPHSGSDRSSSGSVISADALTEANQSPTQLQCDSLDVFIPLYVDPQNTQHGEAVTVGAQCRHSRQTVSVKVSDESDEYLEPVDSGLDVPIGVNDKINTTEQVTFNHSESEQTSALSEGLDAKDDQRQYGGGFVSRRTRPNVSRRLTRKETQKLSRKLTRKMSCRQQHALMMTVEFDEFDELNVVVEGGADDDDDDGDDGDEIEGGIKPAASNDSETHVGDGIENVQCVDINDAGFDQRLTTKLNYDRLQVCCMVQFFC